MAAVRRGTQIYRMSESPIVPRPANVEVRDDVAQRADAAVDRQESDQREIAAVYVSIGLGALAVGAAVTMVVLYGRSATDVVLAAGGAVTAIATYSVARYTRALNRSTSRMEEGARQTLRHLQLTSEQELRAYVFFHRRVLEWQPTGLNIRFKNCGQTPAKNVEVEGYLSVATAEHVGPFSSSTRATENFRASLAPQGELDVHFYPLGPSRYSFTECLTAVERELELTRFDRHGGFCCFPNLQLFVVNALTAQSTVGVRNAGLSVPLQSAPAALHGNRPRAPV
jgi:hypothetical protein